MATFWKAEVHHVYKIQEYYTLCCSQYNRWGTLIRPFKHLSRASHCVIQQWKWKLKQGHSRSQTIRLKPHSQCSCASSTFICCGIGFCSPPHPIQPWLYTSNHTLLVHWLIGQFHQAVFKCVCSRQTIQLQEAQSGQWWQCFNDFMASPTIQSAVGLTHLSGSKRCNLMLPITVNHVGDRIGTLSESIHESTMVLGTAISSHISSSSHAITPPPSINRMANAENRKAEVMKWLLSLDINSLTLNEIATIVNCFQRSAESVDIYLMLVADMSLQLTAVWMAWLKRRLDKEEAQKLVGWGRNLSLSWCCMLCFYIHFVCRMYVVCDK